MASTAPDEEIRGFVQELSDLFYGLQLPLAIIGGVAYNFWREPRFTKDVDFIAWADPAGLAQMRERLLAAGYAVTREQGAFEPSGPDFLRFVLPGTQRMVEFQTAKTDFQELAINRAVTLSEAQPFPVVSPEDLIIMKLIANRSSDHRDLYSLGEIEDLDWPYIEHWSAIWQVEDRLADLRVDLERERRRREELYS